MGRVIGLDVHKDFAEVAEALPGGGVRQLASRRNNAGSAACLCSETRTG